MLNALAGIGARDLFDILLVGAALYAVLVWLKRARAGLVVVGASVLGTVYLGAREFRLELTAWVFQGFFTIFLIVLVVVLQNDLRILFERVALWGFGRKRTASAEHRVVEALCSAVREMASQRRGALIVIPGRDPVARYVQGGERLNGNVSLPLLVSLFDPGSAGHDGAVIVEGDRVTRFAVHLPLSSNFEELDRRGTRHSAALGLTEVTDALCLVVSEERGEVAAVRNGRLRVLDPDPRALEQEILDFLSDKTHEPLGSAGRPSTLRRNWVELVLAGLISTALWFVFVSGSQVSQKTFRVPVLVDNIHPQFTLTAVEPEEIEVTLAGLRRDLYLLDPAAVEVRLDAFMVGFGRRTFDVSERDVRHPPELRVQAVSPQGVLLQAERKGEQTRPAEDPKP